MTFQGYLAVSRIREDVDAAQPPEGRTLQVQRTGTNPIFHIQIWATRTGGQKSPPHLCMQAEYIQGWKCYHVIVTDLLTILRLLPKGEATLCD